MFIKLGVQKKISSILSISIDLGLKLENSTHVLTFSFLELGLKPYKDQRFLKMKIIPLTF